MVAPGERCAAEPAAADRLDRLGAGLQPLAEVGAVRGHDAVERRRGHHVGDAVDLLVAQVGRDLEHDRPVLALAAAEVEERSENLQDVFRGVRKLFAAGVVAADIDREVVGVLVEAAERLQVVGCGIFGRRVGVFADVAAHDSLAAVALQVPDHGFESVVREPDAVDDCPVPGQAEDARPRVAALRTGCDGADLDESEPEGRELPDRLAVAVEAGGQSDRVREADAEDLALERRVRLGIAFAQQPAASGDQPDAPQQEQDGPVGPLDGEREEDRFYDALVHVCMFTDGQKYEKRTDSAKNIRGGRRNGRAGLRNPSGSPSAGGFRPRCRRLRRWCGRVPAMRSGVGWRGLLRGDTTR